MVPTSHISLISEGALKCQASLWTAWLRKRPFAGVGMKSFEGRSGVTLWSD